MTTEDCEPTLESIEIVFEPDLIDPARIDPARMAPDLVAPDLAPAFEDTLPGIGVPPPPWGYGPGIWTGPERRRP